MNSLYRFSGGGAVAERFFRLFETVPPSIGSDFAMANRISCLALAGFSAPETTCQVRHLDELMFAPLRQAAAQAASELFLAHSPGAVTLGYDIVPIAMERVVEGLLPGMEFVRESYGVMFVAKALCVVAGAEIAPTVSVTSVKLALYQSADGQPEAQVISQILSEVSTAVAPCSGGEGAQARLRLMEDIRTLIAE